MAKPNPGLTDEGSDAASPTSEEVPDGLYDSTDEEVVDEEEWYKREKRKAMLRWIVRVENTMDEYKTMPPMSIVLYPDLMDRAWGWGRLVIYENYNARMGMGIYGHVEWSTFMEYLKEYFHRNATSLCPMRAAAYRCLEAEKKYCTTRAGDLTDDDMILSDNIQKRASCIINLEGESFAAAAGLVCIAEEAELMSELPSSEFKTMSVLSNKIRRRALNLTRYKGSESEAVAAALLGMSKETKSVRNLMIRRNTMSLTDISVEEADCGFVRKGTLPLLIKLEDCLAREIAGNVDGNAAPAAAKTEKPIRDSTAGELKSDKSENPIGDSPVVESKSDKSNANENSKDTNEHHGKNNHGNKKRKRNKSKRNDCGKNNHDNMKSKKNKKNMKRMGQTKNNPDNAKFRNGPPANLALLDEMFARAHVTGESSAIPGEDLGEDKVEDAPINLDGSDEDVEQVAPAMKKKKKAKRRISSSMVDASMKEDKNPFLREYKKACNAFASSAKVSSCNKVPPSTTPSLKEVLVLIRECGAIEGTPLFYTASKLAMNPKYRELFSLIETKEGRLDWLQRAHDDTNK